MSRHGILTCEHRLVISRDSLMTRYGLRLDIAQASVLRQLDVGSKGTGDIWVRMKGLGGLVRKG